MKKKRTPELLVGSKYGLFTIIGKIKKKLKSGQHTYHICECDCGNIREIPKHNLTTGASNSCGCVLRGNNQLPPGESSYNEKYMIYRASAKSRGLEFSLTTQEYIEIVIQCCYYCGDPAPKYNRYLRKDGTFRIHTAKGAASQQTIDRAWVNINTVDRIDSKLGYTIQNCVAACWPCNEMKMDSEPRQFIEKIYKIVSFQDSKKELK